ncbi:hypothetical protein [Methylobacterium sp. J-070]|uniref:hypothetical protein n=1 Tax=Methylobacterium sp. J-070 TaxID=2836650 RepID=UPI001FB92BD9|nr:hypothetical protein [Methylobacterium sp. J-070]MCJ2052140.1 hypothetical protein [Methylobacterium sp. J-070]
MPPARPVSPVLPLAALLLVCASCTARADDAAASRHQDWRSCLSRNFRIEAALSGPDRAADAAFKACRAPEDAYLAALAGSPLLDDEDVDRARPLLAGRIRAWLIGGRG